MSSTSEQEVPVIVSVSTYDGIQESNSINVYAQPVPTNQLNSAYPTAVGYASPPTSSQPAASVRAHAVPQSYPGSAVPPLRFGNMNHLQQPGAFHFDERLLRVTTVARSVKCLAVLDLCLILLLAIFQISWIFLIW